jgi:hypothetical protein
MRLPDKPFYTGPPLPTLTEMHESGQPMPSERIQPPQSWPIRIVMSGREQDALLVFKNRRENDVANVFFFRVSGRRRIVNGYVQGWTGGVGTQAWYPGRKGIYILDGPRDALLLAREVGFGVADTEELRRDYAGAY